MTNYYILKFDAKNMLDINYKTEETNDKNWKVSFEYDLTGNIYRNVISSEESYEDNALFYQIRQCFVSLSEKEYDNYFLRQKLIFVDFKDVDFNHLNQNDFEDYTNKSREQLKCNNGLGYRLRWMFDSDNGIKLTFDGSHWQTFVPFDKSSNMARSSIISFIDKDLKNELDKRLLLDMDFTNFDIIPSKYYAYRGLYLSTGYRIEQNEIDGVQLNHETVIVISDKTNMIKDKIFTAKNISSTKQPNYEFFEKLDDNYLNLFDGEGLICPQYAKIINKQLKSIYNFKNDSHSFQIRMPFTKGMLHEVDFNRFFSEQLSYDKQTHDDALLIKDAFGKERNLRKAKIILTKSMFKCFDWIKTFIERKSVNEDDPMRYFFERANHYKHALYVTNSDARFSGQKSILLNYQFLSTLDISPDDFDTLLKFQIKRINAVPKTITSSITQALETEDNYNTTDEDPLPDKWDSVNKKCLKALALNNAFLDDPRIKTIIKAEQKQLTEALCFGQLQVSGEQRFLSCDLLELLRYIYEGIINISFDSAHLSNLKRQRIYSDHFYMPAKKIRLKADKYYGFLRNPHLSRNEQCMLRPYVKATSLHEKYFSHLTGVVMVSCESLVPMALSGADFDGDLVKIICDSRIVSSIAGKEKNDCKDSKHYKHYTITKKIAKRKLPVVKIPSPTSYISNKNPNSDTVNFRNIVNTFSNNIGKISNTAVKIAKIEYNSTKGISEEEKKTGKCCEACTILTGLEIDAAKTGIHPQQNIGLLIDKTNTTDLFLKAKTTLKDIKEKNKYYSPHSEEGNKENTLTMYLASKIDRKGKPRKDRKPVDGLSDIPVYSSQSYVANIERLPGAYLQYLFDKKTSQKQQSQKCILSSSPHFIFEKDDYFIDKEKKEKLCMLTKAYNKVRSLIWEYEQFNKTNNEVTFITHIITLLRIQYDDLEQTLLCGVDINYAIAESFDYLKNTLTNTSSLNESIRRLIQLKWQYTEEEKRTEKIATILNTDTSDLCQSFVELVSNFECNGFKLLYYFLQELKLRYNSMLDIDTITIDYIEKKKKFTDLENSDYKIYYDELKSIYFEYKARKNNDWNKALVKKCREHLRELFNGNMSEALKYTCERPRYDERRTFFWNIFTEDEILRSIYITNKTIR